jgi:adenosylhomocysteine nucleosidase
MRIFRLIVLAAFVACCQATDLLVQGALDDELQPLLAALQNKKSHQFGAWSFWSGKIGKLDVVISRTEVGPINAAAATALGIEHFHPKAIINQGTAGAHVPGLQLWDIVLGEKATDFGAFESTAHQGIDMTSWKPLRHKLRIDPEKDGVRFDSFPGDARLAEAALLVKNPRGRVLKGNVGSAFQFNRELERVKWLQKTYHTDSEDMESAYAAGVATGMKVPFLAVRMISDSMYHHPEYERIAGKYCAEFVLELVRAWKP